MRKTAIIVTLLILTGISMVGFSLYRDEIFHKAKHVANPEVETKDFKEAESLLMQNRVDEAKEIIVQYKGEIERNNESGKKWLNLLLTASQKTKDIPQLIILYGFNPKAFENNEEASIYIADYYISQRKGPEYDKLRKSWNDKETFKDKWIVLDADRLLLEGKKDKAMALLQSKSFQGKADVGRLIRLALYTLNENPKQAWEYLTDAYRKDPNNTEVRSYRGKLLETIGKNSNALTEYIAAVQNDPKNLGLRNQLADFYLRNKKYQQALEIWREVLVPPSQDFIWEMSLFWNKVTIPLQFDWKKYPVPEGHLKQLVDYYLTLDNAEYWNQEAFDKLSQGKHYLQKHQSTYWMRLVSALKNGKFEEAQGLIQFNPFTIKSWDPRLERALLQTLAFRKNGTFSLDTQLDHPQDKGLKESAGQPVLENIEKESFFSQLDSLREIKSRELLKQAMPKSLEVLLQSDDAFSAVFLSAGWGEAGIQLSKNKIVPDNYPDWYAYAMTLAYRSNRGNLEALEFATMQKPTDLLTLLTGEILIAEGSPDAGLAELQKLQKKPTEAGYKATWLMSLVYIEKGDHKKAKDLIEAHPTLSKDITGQETLARIALLEGDENKATQIYGSIEGKSSEAKSYLARKAYANKNWKRARELTEELLKEFPNNPVIRENLIKIIENQEGKANAK